VPVRVAMVTGGARGIGLATASRLVSDGWRVVIADVDGEEAVRAANGIGATGFALDVRDADAFTALVRRVEVELGPVDVLVNNAGIMPVGPFDAQPLDMDRRQLDINVLGVIHGTRAVLPSMRARRSGHVVNLASVAGKVGCPDIAVYSAAKHAVVGLTEALRREYGREGVKFTYVCPAFVRTELISGAPGPRWPPPVLPDDVARAIVRALRTGAVEVYVPRIARLATVLPAVLPRRVVERLGELFGLTAMFSGTDPTKRAAYAARITQ
jgi:NAD(P)-dependent dehydrogenase (short-subunit alcohol dehydrogenase family)